MFSQGVRRCPPHGKLDSRHRVRSLTSITHISAVAQSCVVNGASRSHTISSEREAPGLQSAHEHLLGGVPSGSAGPFHLRGPGTVQKLHRSSSLGSFGASGSSFRRGRGGDGDGGGGKWGGARSSAELASGVYTAAAFFPRPGAGGSGAVGPVRGHAYDEYMVSSPRFFGATGYRCRWLAGPHAIYMSTRKLGTLQLLHR